MELAGAHRRALGRRTTLDAEPIEEAIALLDRGEVRVAEPRDGTLDRQRVGEEGDPPLLPAAQGRADGGRRAPLPRQDPGEVRLRRARRARRPARDRAVRRVPLRGRRADARLREHRRLGRAADDGRHVGDRRLVRADRRRRPPLGRRRHRRRARAAAGSAGDRRGRRVPRLARGRRRGCGRRRRRGDRAERRPLGVDPGDRRHRPGAGRASRLRAAALGRPPGNASEGVSGRAATTSRARSSSASGARRPTSRPL